jgi:hypothetical protein
MIYTDNFGFLLYRFFIGNILYYYIRVLVIGRKWYWPIPIYNIIKSIQARRCWPKFTNVTKI